jgi:hypothetical protein
MIGIFSNNPDKNFIDKLNLPCRVISTDEDVSEIDGLFLDWVPPEKEIDFIYQAQLVEKFVKDIPIVIFDRFFSLTYSEVEYLKKFRTYLFEPAIMTGRNDFTYLPNWISDFSIDYSVEDIINRDNRDYDLVWIYKDLEYKIKPFEKWYVEYARLFPIAEVGYYTRDLADFKKVEYAKNNLKFIESESLPDYTISNFTLAIDTEEAYRMGYFDPMYIFAMNQGCVPLLPVEHRFFHPVFKNLIVENIKELDYYVCLYKSRGPIIEEIFDRIKTYFPEFTIEYACDIVRKCYE